MRSKNAHILLMCSAILAPIVGCQEGVIEHYSARRGDSPELERPRARILAVMLPHKDDATWFFKLVGREKAVENHRAEFDEFVQSVRFPDQPTRSIEWKVPTGWKRYSGSRVNYASFRVGAKDVPASFTVTKLGPDARDPLDNVNRWRNQLGLKPIKKDELGTVVKELNLESGAALIIDLVGATPGEVDEGPPPGITFKKPDAWKQQTDPRGVRLVLFHVTDGEQSAEIGITALQGAAGGLLANVNRWRDQLGLKPVSEEQLKEAQSLKVSGKAGAYFDISGIEKEGRPRQRILGVAVEIDGKTWFFKMHGPRELVGKQEEMFKEFIQSVHIEPSVGDK